MTARPHTFLLLALTAAAGCSLVCTFNGLQQPCDADGDCLSGFQCLGGLCVGDGGVGTSGGGTSGGSSGGGCSSDSACLAGACVSGACSSVPTAWSNGKPQAASLDSCYPWPPFPSAGNEPVALSGCLLGFPGDTLPSPDGGLADGGATIEVSEDGTVVIAPTPLVASTACASGLGYRVEAPPGELLDVIVNGPGWTIGNNPAVEVAVGASGAVAVRNVGTLSVTGWSQKLTAVTAALGLPEKTEDALEVGSVRDCSGLPLSGVSLQATQPDGGGMAFAYLDPSGTPVASRTATDSSGLFAAVALPGSYTVSFVISTTAGSQTLATLPLTVTAGGTGWIDLAPQGP